MEWILNTQHLMMAIDWSLNDTSWRVDWLSAIFTLIQPWECSSVDLRHNLLSLENQKGYFFARPTMPRWQRCKSFWELNKRSKLLCKYFSNPIKFVIILWIFRGDGLKKMWLKNIIDEDMEMKKKGFWIEEIVIKHRGCLLMTFWNELQITWLKMSKFVISDCLSR